MSFRIPSNTSLAVSALTSLSGNYTSVPISPVSLSNISWTSRTNQIYSLDTKALNPYLVTPLSSYGLNTIIATGSGTIVTYISASINDTLILWLQKNNSTQFIKNVGNVPACLNINMIQNKVSSKTTTVGQSASFTVQPGDRLDFFLGSGPISHNTVGDFVSGPYQNSSILSYYFVNGSVKMTSSVFTKWITLSAPVHFLNYKNQDFDFNENNLSLSDFRGAVNYDANFALTDTVNVSTFKTNVYYNYAPNNNVYLYNDTAFYLSGIKLITRHLSTSGSYVSLNANITNNTGYNLFFRINDQKYNNLPLCTILPPNKTLNVNKMLPNLSSYMTCYLETKTSKGTVTVSNNYSTLQFTVSS